MASAILAVAAVLSYSTLGAAQSAVCKPGWEWASNSLNQNPCEIAGNLEAPCRNISAYSLPQLNASNNYVAPGKSDLGGQECECNTVMYSLFMACTACQNVSSVQKWSFWEANCNSVYVTQFPGKIPDTTKVPNWAYLNVATNDIWSATDSQAAGDSPESTNTPIPTNTLSNSGGGSPSNSGSSDTGSNPPSNTSPATSGKSSNAGAIAGGVVGGLAFLGIVAGVTSWLVIRNRRNAAAGNANSMSNGSQPPYDYNQPLQSPGLNMGGGDPQMRVYNPNDPSSYPVAYGNASDGQSNTVYPNTLYSDHSNPGAGNQRGAYTGVPEL